MPRIARVVTDLALDRAFDYSVPAELASVLQIGHRVRVPFGHREAAGVVVAFPETAGVAALKPIHGITGATPAVLPSLIELAAWMARYYICPFETALKAVLPEAVRRTNARHLEQLQAAPARQPEPAELSLLHRRAPVQAAAFEALLRHGPVLLAESSRTLGAPPSALRALEKRGWVRIQGTRVERDPFQTEAFVSSEAITLNPEQAVALEEILRQMAAPEPRPLLLHGVTGSGKTEVYLQAIARCLEAGRGAIVLVPEIALTPQSVERFKSRFQGRGTEVAVLHSRLSAGERHDEWHRIRDGRARVVVGARSALFAPVAPLGLIVVDEEHEPSYKQQESPRYNARDVAVVRARMEHAAVVLGTATPALESFHNARAGRYVPLSLPNRVDHQSMPAMRVVDMRQEAIKAKGPPILSNRLKDAIHDRLAKGEQVMLFLNRRGFAPTVLCRKCGHVEKCPNCSVSLTFHQARDRVLCHLCGHEAPAPRSCRQCGDASVRFAGLGTEKLELAVQRLFPKASVRRMDSDTMTRKHSYAEVLGEFRKGQVDILVGTQMIAKGLHFPNVTLVGIVYADLALHLPDFRASERVFQLLTQVAGRAGRGDVAGEVIVQSYTPYHPAIQFARRHDSTGFYEDEIAFRKEFRYPPASRAVLVLFRGASEEKTRAVAEARTAALRALLPARAELTGPSPAPIARIEGKFRFHLFLRHPREVSVGAALREAIVKPGDEPGVQITVDVDPLSLL